MTDDRPGAGASAAPSGLSDLDIVTGRRVQVREGMAAFDGRARGVGLREHHEVVDARGVVHRVVAGDLRLLD